MQPRHCLVSPSGGISRRSVPETSPCHVQAKQNGELDLRRAACLCREHSPRNRDRGELVIGIGNASAQFDVGSARGQPRLAPCVRNPRSPARRPIQVDEVEPSAHVSPQGIGVPNQEPLVVLALLRLSSASSSPCRAEVGSTGVHDRHLPLSTLMFLANLFLAGEEAFGVERLLLAQEVIHRTADLRFEHG
jgi:hypothetical protein